MPKRDLLVETYRLASRLAPFHRWIVRIIQLAAFALSAFVAFQLRFEFTVEPRYRPHLLAALCVWVAAKSIVFAFFRLDRGWWRYISMHDLSRVAAGNIVGSALGFAGIAAFGPAGFPRSLYILDFLICFVLTAGMRLATRFVADFAKYHATARTTRRALIYGAGDAGVALLREIRQNPALPYKVVGFIDDNPAKAGSTVQQARVYGDGGILPDVVRAHSVDIILIAMPSASGSDVTRILHHCHRAGVPFKTIPGLAEIIEGNGLAAQIRDVAVEDLLGRNPIHLEDQDIREKLEGKVVLITGAAGSIGSEICRQVARFRPAAIVAFEAAETPLFQIEQEMLATHPDVQFVPEIGSIQSPRRLDEVFAFHHPDIVFHAAAYKHVPLMESHVFQAVENNVFGTYNVALAAARHGAADFVMISSDKAVYPTNVMGLTKRVAELVVRSFCGRDTKFVSVRFGNVLGSNGSVVPTFKKQIAAGGPVTVTHPEMRRFFMTIPEAVQLVLQASTMSQGGEIFVLDMGEPVKIVDLARNLILLSGLRPDHDIKIEFTGIRPGEKLYEEVAKLEENTLPTYHEKIRIFQGAGLPEALMRTHIDILKDLCQYRDAQAVLLELKQLVPEYNPSPQMLHQCLLPEAEPYAYTA